LTDHFRLTGRRILITGASGVIGRACAIMASHLGASLILHGRDGDRLAEVLSACALGEHAIECLDLENTREITEWVKTLATRHGPLSGVVHAVGLQVPRTLRYLTVQEFEKVQRLNCTAALFLAQGARQRTVCQTGASIVFISSVLWLLGQPMQASYAASKGGLVAMSRALALEMARDGFRVNCVAPGLIASRIEEQLKRSMPQESYENICKMHPLGLGTPEDVAHSVAFLLSPASRWITGSVLTVDGGYSAQ
jgi:NAD(P)-dependent dehydrogenase (short-subunit alcohol dehydrogenase family)